MLLAIIHFYVKNVQIVISWIFLELKHFHNFGFNDDNNVDIQILEPNLAHYAHAQHTALSPALNTISIAVSMSSFLILRTMQIVHITILYILWWSQAI